MITSATLWVDPELGRRSGTGLDTLVGTASDAAGMLKLSPIAGDQPVELSLRKPGYQFARREVRFADTPPLSWTLEAAEPTGGRVIDADSGDPVAGAKIFLVRRSGFAPTGVRDPRNDFARLQQGDSLSLAAGPLAVTDDEGRFSIETWRDDCRYAIAVLGRDHRPRVLANLSSGQKLDEVALEPPLTVRGRLLGDLSKLARRPGGKRTLAYRNVLRVGEESFRDLFAVPVDSGGTFEIDQLLPGNLQLLLPGGERHLRVSEPLDELTIDLSEPVAPIAEDHREIQVTLEPTEGQPLRGEVRLSWSPPPTEETTRNRGQPRQGVYVMLMPVDREAADYRGHRSAQTDAEGAFRIEGVEPIQQKLFLHGGGVIDVQGPFESERDEFDNLYWAVRPESAIDPATIIIEQ